MRTSSIMKVKSLTVMGAVALACAATAAHSAVLVSFGSTNVRIVGTEKATADVAADAAAIVGLPAITFEVRSTGYVDTDRVVLTVAGATVRSAAAIGTVTCAANTLTTPTMTLTYSATATSGNSIVLTVGGRNADAVFDGTATGMRCTIPNNSIQLQLADLTSAKSVSLNIQAFSASSGFATAYDVLRDAAGTAYNQTALVSLAQVSLAPSDLSATTNPTSGEVLASSLLTSSATRAIGLSATVPSTGTAFSTNTSRGLTSTDTVTTCASLSSGASGGVLAAADANCLYSDTLRWNYRVEDGNAALAASDGLMELNSGATPLRIASAGTVLVTTITGGFNFLDDDGNGCTAADLNTGANQVRVVSRAVPAVAATLAATATAPTLTVAADCSTLTHTHTVSAADGRDVTNALLFTFRGYNPQAAAATDALTGTVTTAQINAAGSVQGRTIAATSFGMTTRWQDAGLTTTYATLSPSAGTWSAPASTATTSAVIPYMPYGSGISRIVYAANRGTVASTASFTATNEAGTVCAATNFPSVSVPAGGVVNLSGAIDTGVRACFSGIDASSGKVIINVTYTGSTSLGTHTTTSSYNVNGNRNVVINTSNQ